MIQTRIKETTTHVFGQISCKKGCLEKIVFALKSCENKESVEEALKEILGVDKRYEKFSTKSYEEAKKYGPTVQKVAIGQNFDRFANL